MTYQTQQILKKTLSLPPIERAELVEKVFDSFNGSRKNNLDRHQAPEWMSPDENANHCYLKSADSIRWNQLQKYNQCS